jgi:voltage-gated potassium channel
MTSLALPPRSRQDRWTRSTDVPLLVVAALFLVAYAWDVIGALHGVPDDIAQVVIWGTWAVFVADYIVKLVLANQRFRWFYTHIFDFLLVVLPFLRPLRLLRVAMVWTAVYRVAGRTLRGRLATYVIGSSLLLVFVASLAVLEAERPAPHATIVNFGDAIWWAFVTITSVGYGDFEPVTVEGRVVAVGLMIAGVALLGVVAATFASWLISQVAAIDEKDAAATRAEVAELSQVIEQLRADLQQRNPTNGTPVSDRQTGSS